jgi:phosphatidylglycerophosphate synthase
VRPNTISAWSVIFAAGAGACLVVVPGQGTGQAILLFVGAVVLIQLRLLCNLFDGMVAIDGGLKTKSGEVFNDLPDRIADPVILVCAGYAIRGTPWAIELGWAAGLLAVLTAYTRVLGGCAGASQHFCGPMAKQHRMATVTAALVGAAVGVSWRWHEHILLTALGIIVVGCVITVARRTILAVRELEEL